MNSQPAAFLKTEGKKIVNDLGQEIFLKGVALGNWFLQEGYMWHLNSAEADRPRRIEALIQDLTSTEYANHFWDRFYDSYITEADILQIAREGFNSIRVPLNARLLLKEDDYQYDTYLEQSFKRIDTLLDWCRGCNIYVFLDMHAAPGGQTGANIDDSINNFPEVFTNRIYWNRTVLLWKTIANRYKCDPIIGGYDLLNEPLKPEYLHYKNDLLNLYKDITNAIREVDDQHIVIWEGARWATDFSIFSEKFDSNMILQFHKYWNAPDYESIEPYLEVREHLNVPLWMGESGENSNSWYMGNFQLLEDHGVHRNFWSWKKMSSYNCPCSFSKPVGWERIQAYLHGGEKPSAEESTNIFNNLLEQIMFKNCEYHSEVINAIFRQVPLRIPSVYYGYKGPNQSFSINKRAESEVEFRTGDGVTIKSLQHCKLNKEAIRNHWGHPEPYSSLYVELAEKEWLTYYFCVEVGKSVNVMIDCSLETESVKLRGTLNNRCIFDSILSGEKTWNLRLLAEQVRTTEKDNELKIEIVQGKLAIQTIEIH